MNTYFFEVTDTFGGEANYCWVRRFKTQAKSELGAIQKLSRYSGLKLRKEYDTRYNAKNACVCVFIVDCEYQQENNNFIEI